MSIENRVESEQEKVPTKEEIFTLLQIDAEKCKIDKEMYDGNGLLCRLDVTVEGGIEYMYTREGKFDGSHESLETDVYMTTPTTYPDNIYRYKDGAWKKLS